MTAPAHHEHAALGLQISVIALVLNGCWDHPPCFGESCVERRYGTRMTHVCVRSHSSDGSDVAYEGRIEYRATFHCRASQRRIQHIQQNGDAPRGCFVLVFPNDCQKTFMVELDVLPSYEDCTAAHKDVVSEVGDETINVHIVCEPWRESDRS